MNSDARRSQTPLMSMGVLGTLLVPAIACAHVGVAETSSLTQGLSHPPTGLDHIAAMVAVGLWAAQRGGRGLWAVPLSFLTLMAVGALLAIAGVSLPLVEPVVAASVLVLGLLVAAAVRLPILVSGLVVGLFALFHGHAHGTEIPELASGLAYGLGFILTTALLHGVGIGFSRAVRGWGAPALVRLAGGATAAFGLYLSLA